ncbi:hypothetical protein [Aneurinibacillus sp. REN35]|uniref:hypothetical protein n=1 Tax=Aneurinibacillus sp. REN35 TaxID=3237286 RepID=UPI003528C1A1
MDITYAQNIIVGIVKENIFSWYILDKDDLYDFLSDQLDYSTLSSHIEGYRTTTEYIRNCVIEENYRCADDTLKFNPSVYMNFDTKCLFSLYPEYTAFEKVAYKDWIGRYVDFTNEVPDENRYWMIDGKNYIEDTFNYFVERGMRTE